MELRKRTCEEQVEYLQKKLIDLQHEIQSLKNKGTKTLWDLRGSRIKDSFDPEDVKEALKEFFQNSDMSIGSRYRIFGEQLL